ncbi:Appr-1-p processing domain protein [Clavulina sp. PMI_390]|nr:Appr-1-p processing domain protein [Clavulina sp. PMI_390]
MQSCSFVQGLALVQGDITKLKTDAIVNAANSRLLGGGGVDGAIHRAAGPQLLAECRGLNGANTGECKITLGYRLPAKHVIHAVGPIYTKYEEGENANLLGACYRESLKLASKNNLKTIAFPSISTGIYGYPIRAATHVAVSQTLQFLESAEGASIERVVFVTFSDEDFLVYQDILPSYFTPVPPPPPYSEESEE